MAKTCSNISRLCYCRLPNPKYTYHHGDLHRVRPLVRSQSQAHLALRCSEKSSQAYLAFRCSEKAMMQLMLSMQVCGSIGNWMCSVLSVYMCMNKLKQFLSSETITREALKSFRFMAQTPSCAGMCRCGIMGEVQTYLIDMTCVQETSEAAKSMINFRQFLSSETVTREELKSTHTTN